MACVLCAAGAAPAHAGAETERLDNLALDRFLAGQARVMRVFDPLRIAAAPFCKGELAAVGGMFAANRYTFLDLLLSGLPFEKALNHTAVERFGLGKRPRVLLVVPGLPAARAGVQVGDVMVKIAGRKVDRYVDVDSLRAGQDGDRLRITVERAGAQVELEMETQVGCAPPGRFTFGTELFTSATRWGASTGVYASAGVLEFLPSDDALAVILGHELANLMLKRTWLFWTPRGNEADADYLGLYLAARAGFDVTVAPDVWEAAGRIDPYSTIDSGPYTHLTSPERVLLMRSTVAEIAGKRKRGEPLDPFSP